MAIEVKPRAPLSRLRPEDRLAVDGGVPVITPGYILSSRWPRISDEDVARVVAQLRSGLLTEMASRAQTREFESEMAVFAQTRYAVATNSGTAALHCAVAGVGVEAGDEVVVPSLAYVACGAAVVHQNATPVFADVDPLTYNLTPATVEAALTPRTRAIMVVHLHGMPADVAGIMAVARRHGLPVIEDFSQAVGSAVGERRTGGLATVGAASLMAGKNLPSAGEGGVMVTSDREVRNRGAAVKTFSEAVDAFGNYETIHATLGYNYRINLLSAAMVSSQLFRIDEYTQARRAGARRLDAALAELPGFAPPAELPGTTGCYHMYRFRFDPAAAGLAISVDQMREGLKAVFWEEGVPLVQFQNQPLAGHELFRRRGNGARIEDFPGALQAIRDSLVIGYPTQAATANPEAVDAYARVFGKLRANLRAFERFAAELPGELPWSQPARLF